MRNHPSTTCEDQVSKVNQLVFSDEGLSFDMDKVKDKIFLDCIQNSSSNIDSNGIWSYLVYNHITSLGGRIAVEVK
jgi:hypothetical protein